MGFQWIYQDWYKKELNELENHIVEIKKIIEFIDSQGHLVGSEKIKSESGGLPVNLTEYVINKIKEK